eukprot:TRINITY_DN4929_c0_g1_i1.p1 TRINITY_DN4929_c0_g1~~TRINITY_DN4929_c0_g1_i1.p1  ORF type:complete len:205 (-),score=49.88 TRINITY_DN4929_c0_g1_i1:43-657(-)
METGQLLEAIDFACRKHKDQRRKGDDSPYINHPVNVAFILSKEGGITDIKTLQAAILHDTVEDTDTTFEELTQVFGQEVATIVMEVTDDKSLAKDVRKKEQVRHAKHASHAAKLVKLGDKLNNLRSLRDGPPPKSWDIKQTEGYFIWAKAVVDGIRGTNHSLEASLDDVFQGSFMYDGEWHQIPKDDHEKRLEAYYQQMSLANN